MEHRDPHARLALYVFTDPLAARAVLMYRYHTLGAAWWKAERTTIKARSTPGNPPISVEETTRGRQSRAMAVPILTGEQEHHIRADIACAVWQYWRVTGDDNFMVRAGGHILVETARF